MKKYLLFVLITVLCVDLVSCAFIQDNNEETEQTGAEVSSENDGTKPLNNPCFIRLDTAKGSYGKDEKVQLQVYIGCDKNWMDHFGTDGKEYKVVFKTIDNIELTENNEMPLNDFPGERWFMHENFSYNLWSKFPEPVVIEIDALEFKNIERGIVLAEIVDIDVELDDVRAFQAPLFFNSLGDNVAFSTAGNDCIHK